MVETEDVDENHNTNDNTFKLRHVMDPAPAGASAHAKRRLIGSGAGRIIADGLAA